MLQVKDVSKCYVTEGFSQTALDDVAISFRDNEFAAILGPSGSGKTTLLNIIGGLDRYDSGDLIIDGISTKDYKASDWDTFRNNRIGFVFQSYNLIGHQNVLKNVELALTLSGVGKAERRERALEALEKVGLKDHVNKKPNQLSGGQMQRVAIARALVNDPEILLADEPTGALDSQTSVEVMDLLQEIANDRLVIMVTHNPELAEKYANRIVTLKDGKIMGDTNPYEPTADDLAKVSAKEPRKASMSFLTALELSFNNLMSKKGRTIMTAFAGSIGIIGIAAILALSNGVNNYIHDVEEDTLTSYPITISKSGLDLSSLVSIGTTGNTGDGSSGEDAADGNVMNNKVGEIPIVNSMVSKMKNNDLSSLKTYIESDEGSTIRDNSSFIDYDYGISPIIYVKGPTDSDYRKANPDTSLSALGLGSTNYSNSTLSSFATTNIFQEMIDPNLVMDSYDVKAGHWPENKNECVLVVTQDGQVLDY
ncbi:MAG: ABC transporter ATP-binding protein, partial [Phoenicibacter congonensis]|nr:ABC transporter ATP-binding protein [Phoenicibacter congonensis]